MTTPTETKPDLHSEPTGPSPMAGRNVLIGLTVALALWALYHALGSYFGGMGQENLPRSVWRSVVVIGCMAAFLGFWWILMLTRKRPDSRTDR